MGYIFVANFIYVAAEISPLFLKSSFCILACFVPVPPWLALKTYTDVSTVPLVLHIQTDIIFNWGRNLIYLYSVGKEKHISFRRAHIILSLQCNQCSLKKIMTFPKFVCPSEVLFVGSGQLGSTLEYCEEGFIHTLGLSVCYYIPTVLQELNNWKYLRVIEGNANSSLYAAEWLLSCLQIVSYGQNSVHHRLLASTSGYLLT